MHLEEGVAKKGHLPPSTLQAPTVLSHMWRGRVVKSNQKKA